MKDGIMTIALIPPMQEALKNPKCWTFYNNRKGLDTESGIYWGILSEFDDWSKIDYFLFCNFYFEWSLPILRKINMLQMRDRIIYYMAEPDVVLFYHSKKYLPLIQKFTDCIITWNKELVNDKIVFFSLPFSWQNLECRPESYSPKTFKEKGLLCCISGNKKSRGKNELYSERKKVIEYFEMHHADDFDLFGNGWESCGYKNYRGTCKFKHDVYSNYRFALSFENIRNMKGGVTEKIFDCINYGIVPIYIGADDILDYIPKECFIDYNMFHSISQMYEYLKTMDEEKYSSYIHAQQEYLDLGGYKEFTIDSWSKRVRGIIRRKRKGKRKAKWVYFLPLYGFRMFMKIKCSMKKILMPYR